MTLHATQVRPAWQHNACPECTAHLENIGFQWLCVSNGLSCRALKLPSHCLGGTGDAPSSVISYAAELEVPWGMVGNNIADSATESRQSGDAPSRARAPRQGVDTQGSSTCATKITPDSPTWNGPRARSCALSCALVDGGKLGSLLLDTASTRGTAAFLASPSRRSLHNHTTC